jgi:hypothetical protein
MLRPSVVAALALTLACHRAPRAATPAASDPRLDRVDVFGSRQIGRDDVIAQLGRELSELVGALDADDDVRALALRDEVIAEIAGMGAFAYVELHVIGYYDPPARYLTIDLVDEADRITRMPFADPPSGAVPDPDGLVALWRDYEGAMWPVLADTGGAAPSACPAWHCIAGYADPRLARFGDAFVARVPAHEPALVQVLRESGDEIARGAAAFLLAHLADGARVVELMIPAFRDPSEHVRNNAMRVVAMIATHHPEIGVPLAPVLEALRYPATTDRNKAAAILAGLAARPELHDAIARDAGDVLLAMLRLSQPNNHDFAYAILKHVSGETFAPRDYAAWERWLLDADQDRRSGTSPQG